MTKLSATNITHLNNSMKAAQDVNLGTLLSTMESGSATALTTNNAQQVEIDALQVAQSMVSGSQVVTAVHTNASAVNINTGIGAVKEYISHITRSGSLVPGGYVVNSSGSLVFGADSTGSYVLTANDVISYFAWKDTSIVATGSQAVTSVHTNGSAVTLDTSLGSVVGYMAQLSRSGSLLANGYVVNSSGSLVFGADSTGSYVLTVADNINYFAW